MTPQRPQTSALVHALSRSSLIRVSSLADAVVDRVWPDVYAPLGPVAKDDLWRSCHDNLGNVLGFLNEREDRAARHLATARSTGERRARQRCPLEWVQHAWRVGGQVMWDDFAGQTGALDADELGQLVRSAGDVWQVVGEFTAEMSAAYHAVERDIGTPDRRVHELLDALFDGRGAEVAAEASRVLGVPARGRFVVVVSEDDRPTVPGRLVRVLRPHGVVSVWHRRAGLTVGVLVVDSESGWPTELLRPLLSGRTGLSSVVTDLTDLPEGHRTGASPRGTRSASRSRVEIFRCSRRMHRPVPSRSPMAPKVRESTSRCADADAQGRVIVDGHLV